MRKTRMQKGITLIALIITIIILLILAAVTIGGNLKNIDIIRYAQRAAEEYNESEILEKLNLVIAEVRMKMIESPNLDYAIVLKEQIEVAFPNKTVRAEEAENADGYIVTIEELNIQYFVEKNGNFNEYVSFEKIIQKYPERWILLEDNNGKMLGILSDSITEIVLEKELEVVYIKNNMVINEKQKVDIESEDIKIKFGGAATSLQKVNVNNLSVCFEDEAFTDCGNLIEVINWNRTLNKKMPNFENCVNLNTISIPSGITSIGQYAFEDCTNLKSVTIPSSVTTINSAVFATCTDLNSINIDKAIDSISGSPWGAPNATVTWAQ